ncbi:MAG: hypothetical protein EPO30_06105 [Lysobacteraceae bacterium]|nr:MAG: hypothetical protein EPO30_06105 [Xanthomonadaceae bacterium]
MQATHTLAFQRSAEGLLRARVAGIRTVESTIGYWESILEEVAREKPRGLLVLDQLVGEELSASEWKQLVLHVLGRGLEGVPIAHAKPFSFDQISYCERYANEYGLLARTFRREAEAEAWLQAQAG